MLQWSEVQHLDHHGEQSALPHLRRIVHGSQAPTTAWMRQDTPAYSLTVHRCSGTAERRAKRSDSVGEAPSPWPQIKRPFKVRHSMTPRRQQGLTFALVCQILSAHIADTPREVPGVAFLTVPAHTHTSANPLDLACKQGACLGMWTPDGAVMMVPAHGQDDLRSVRRLLSWLLSRLRRLRPL